MTALENVDQLIGRRIGDRYQIVSRIGVGAVATIYRAREVRTGTDVAVKVVRSEIGRNPTVSARFQREVKAASKLDHPGIVRVLDWGLDRDMPWLAMELIEGEDLFEVLDRAGPLPQAWSVAVTMRVCEALEVAHAEGVVHRDLKPENIMLTTPDPRTGEQLVKVLDFGIAKLVGPLPGDMFSDETVPQVLTKAGSAVGTPSHMAPEQARGSEVDGRADIYAVGVLLYEMITGHLPFEGTNPMLVAIQQVRDAPPSPRLHLPAINPSLEMLILRMLEKDPADRPQTAAALAGELLSVLATIDDGEDPTVRSPQTASTVSAIPGHLQRTITEVKARSGRDDGDDDEDDEPATRLVADADDEEDPSTAQMMEDDGPATRLVDDDGPATRLVEDDDEGPSTALMMDDDDGPATRLVADEDDEPSTRLVEDDDGPSTRLVSDGDDGQSTRFVDDGPATRLTVPRPSPKFRSPPQTKVIEDEWEGKTERVFVPSDLGAYLADPDGEDVTLRQDPLEENRFDIVDELTNLDRRPKGSTDAGGAARQRPQMDSEAPVATVVVDADPLIAAAASAARAARAAGLGTRPIPEADTSGPDPSPEGREVRRASHGIEDGDSEAPVATVVADQAELVEAARRSRNVAARITGEVPRVREHTPRPPVGNAVPEAPPPPPPASEPGAGSATPNPFSDRRYETPARADAAQFSDRRYDKLPSSSVPHFPPRPDQGDGTRPRATSAMSHPAASEQSAREVRAAARSGMDHSVPLDEPGRDVRAAARSGMDLPVSGTAPVGVDAPTDWQSPVSRNYRGELEDMLRQMPKNRGRPVFTILLVAVLVSAAIAVLAWVLYF